MTRIYIKAGNEIWVVDGRCGHTSLIPTNHLDIVRLERTANAEPHATQPLKSKKRHA